MVSLDVVAPGVVLPEVQVVVVLTVENGVAVYPARAVALVAPVRVVIDGPGLEVVDRPPVVVEVVAVLVGRLRRDRVRRVVAPLGVGRGPGRAGRRPRVAGPGRVLGLVLTRVGRVAGPVRVTVATGPGVHRRVHARRRPPLGRVRGHCRSWWAIQSECLLLWRLLF